MAKNVLLITLIVPIEHIQHYECYTWRGRRMNTRQSEIVDLLQEKERVDVAGLAEHFSVSPMTLHRDLRLLE